jgi:hypothetical protein
MNEIIKETANRLGMSEDLVGKIIRNYFRALKKSITKVDYKRQQTLDGVKTNAVIPGLGKLIVPKNKKDNFKADKYYG